MENIPVVTAEQMYACDRTMIEDVGIPSAVLMENAASAVFHFLCQRFSDLQEKRILVFAGPGKNGEDGLVLARQLTIQGIEVVVYALPEKEKAADSFVRKVNTLSQLGVTVVWKQLPESTASADIVIDAIFGIGLSRPPSGLYADAITWINESNLFVISLDIPSGIAASTGRQIDSSPAVFCNACISFGLPKPGNLILDGYQHTDELLVSYLHAPYQQYANTHYSDLLLNLPLPLLKRDKLGYKNSFGKALIVAGSQNYRGAPHFVTSAFMKAGGGYTHLITTEDAANTVAALTPEVVLHPFPVADSGSLPLNSLETIEELGASQDMLLIGPGLSITKETEQILQKMVSSETLKAIPLLIDGDGLTLLAKAKDSLLNRLPYTTILTPHAGEMARLTGKTVQEVIESPIQIAQEFSRQWKVNLVLKGPRSVIATREHLYLNTTGNEALGTAGSGDVLDGMIAAFCCANNDLSAGLRTAVFLHGLTGNQLSSIKNSRSVTASDLLLQLPSTLTYYEKEYALKNQRIPVDFPGIRFID